MKRHLRVFLFNLLALSWVTKLLPGVSYSGGYQTIVFASLVFTLVNLFVKPLLNILLLPINLLTLGLFRWLVNVLTLYLVVMIVPQFKISGFFCQGLTYYGFIIPKMYLSIFSVYILASCLISLITTFLLWLSK